MQPTDWQLQTPISGVIFDCDGTLSAIEGINELARKNGVHKEVASLTELAMASTGINADLYQKRLNLVYPHEKQVQDLGYLYFTHCVPDAKRVIDTLQQLKKCVYIVSAGLYPAVKIFGELLRIPKEHIYAVNIHFDSLGHYVNYEDTSPLVKNNGKRLIVEQLKSFHSNIIHIGDGLNDYVTHDLVTRFIGYGGVYFRQNIKSLCQYYIQTLSLSPLLPLMLTEAEFHQLTPAQKELYHHGLAAIREGKV